MNSFRLSQVLGIVSVVVLTSNSCTKQKLVTQTNPTDASTGLSSTDNLTATVQVLFNKNVGAPIDSATGRRWMKNFAKSKPAKASADYIIPSGTLKSILESKDIVGISLYYAVDDSGGLLVLPVGVDGSGKIISAPSIAMQSAVLDWQTARQWIGNYKGKVKSHFFGTETFKRLLIDQNSPAMRTSFALDDAGTPQLLLSNASVANTTTYADKSAPCPPVCPN